MLAARRHFLHDGSAVSTCSRRTKSPHSVQAAPSGASLVGFVMWVFGFAIETGRLTPRRRVLSSNSVLNILSRPLSKTKLAAGAMPPAARPELLRADLKGWLFKLTEGVSIDDYSTYRATRFAEPV